MCESFDFIAIPKGQAPGGLVQSSDGSWYLVTPAHLSLADAIGHIKSCRAGRPISDDELQQAGALLTEKASEKV